MAKLQSIKNVYGSNEHALTADEAVVYLEKRMIKEQGKSDGQSLNNSILDYAKKYGINKRESHASLQREEMSDEAIARIRGVDERFEFITAEALQCMNKEYFGYLMDASYSQDTQAPEVVSQGIEACEGNNGNVFTTAELLESAQYIVGDYEAFEQYVMDIYSQDIHVDNQNLVTVNGPAGEVELSGQKEAIREDRIRKNGFQVGDRAWKEIEGTGMVTACVITDIKNQEYAKIANIRTFKDGKEFHAGTQTVPMDRLYMTREECSEAISQADATEQMQMDFGEAVEQLSLDLDNGLEK